MEKKIHVFTSVALNYIPKARVLFESLRRYHKDWVFHVALADEMPQQIDLSKEPFDFLIKLSELGIPNYRAWAFIHSIVELATAIKPFVLKKLLAQDDCLAVIYFDPDIVVFSALDDILGALAEYSILLVPHLTEPEVNLEGVIDNEIGCLKHGVYNLGFLAVSKTDIGVNFAEWWANRLYHFCRADICNGLFTDQRWIDLVPAFFDDVAIIKSKRHDVASWNLSTRQLSGDFGNGFYVDGEPLGFYHFTGFDRGDHHIMVAKNAAGNESVIRLLRWYEEAIARHGKDPLCRLPWQFGFFDNGEQITPAQRIVYRERVDLQRAFPNPYNSVGYLAWWKEQAPIEYPDLFVESKALSALQRFNSQLSPGFKPDKMGSFGTIQALIKTALAHPKVAKSVLSKGINVWRKEGFGSLLRRVRRF